MDNNYIRFGKYDKIYYEQEVLSNRQVEAIKLIINTMKDNGEL